MGVMLTNTSNKDTPVGWTTNDKRLSRRNLVSTIEGIFHELNKHYISDLEFDKGQIKTSIKATH